MEEIEEMTMKMDINVDKAEKSKADLASLIEMNNKTAGIQKTAAEDNLLPENSSSQVHYSRHSQLLICTKTRTT